MQSAAVPFGHFKDVHQSFPRAGQTPLVAIENITFDLVPGQLVTLLGPSGCGKTTFLKIVAGLIGATSGTIQINGHDVTESHPDFGIVFQQANLMPWRPVIENVPPPAPRSCWLSSISPASSSPIRRSSPAACSSASRCAAR
jgi:ABC-type nitrate/sulfonate/bicarbonate transport system ATPase subunit